MLTLNKTFNDTRAIKVLVVPIGENSLFDRQFEIVSKRRSVPMYELNKPSGDGRPTNSPFKNLNWESTDGSLLFDYLRFDRVSSGLGDLDSFQCNRRYLHVIGLINYPELEGSKYRLEEDMDYYTRRYPNVILRRYFVFNMFNHPNSNSWTIPTIPSDPNAIVVFPPDGECEGGNNMIDIHLHEVMAGVALKIVMALEAQAAVFEEARLKSGSSYSKIPPGMALFTTYDEMEEGAIEGGGQGSISLANASSKMKKRIGGRLRKIVGDLCLQGASPLDALENFIGAISECKSQGDNMWLAGAYEGFASSILCCLEQKIPIEELIGRDLKSSIQAGLSLNSAIIKLAEERCVEALGLYSRNMAFSALEVECSLKVARMYETATSGVADRDQKVLEFLLRAVSVPGLNRQKQMECTLEAAFVCARLNLKRKYAFFLFLAALFAADSENSTVTHLMMKCALQQYGINFNEEEQHTVVISSNADAGLKSEGASFSPENRWEDGEAIGKGQSWAGMRRLLYAQCAYFGREAGDVVSAARCLAGMLRLLAESDIRWRQSTASWLPRNFTPDDLAKLFLICNNTNATSLIGRPVSTPVRSIQNEQLSSRVSNLTISTARDSMHAAPERSSIASSVDHTGHGAKYSPSTNSLSSSHTMASFRNIYSKDNYNRLQSKMRVAGGRLVDFHENVTKQVFDFSHHSEDRDYEFSDVASDVGSVRAFVPGFLSDTPAKSNPLKRSVTVPHLESFVTSLICRPSNPHSSRYAPRSASLSTAIGLTGIFSQSGDQNIDSSTATGLLGPTGTSDSAPSTPLASAASNSSASIFAAFGNSVAIPSTITSKLFSTPELAISAMVAAGQVDENGNPIRGALTPSTNCMTRTWIGSNGSGILIGLDKMQPLQEGCIRRLEKFCDEVPPSCPVYMGDMPFLVSITPLELPANNKPYPISRPTPSKLASEQKQDQSGSSVLYYDPFMAKRDKKLKESSQGPLEVVWTQGVACKVVVCFTNPLAVPIRLSCVSLMLQEVGSDEAISVDTTIADESGKKCYDVTPESISIPSIVEGGGTFQTILSVTPIRPCVLRLVGIRFFIRNAMYISLVDEDGQGVRKRKELAPPWAYPRCARDIKAEKSAKEQKRRNVPASLADAGRGVSMTIRVAPSPADIRVTKSWPRDCDKSCLSKLSTADVASADASASTKSKDIAFAAVSGGDVLPTKLSLYDGECRRESIVVKNVSSISIEDIRLSVTCTPRRGSEKTKGIAEQVVLLPWSGPLKDAAGEVSSGNVSRGGNKISARAAAAILDHKSYIAEKEKLRLEELVGNSANTAEAVEDVEDVDVSDDEIANILPLVRVVSVEAIDYECESCEGAPIPACGSVRIILEFSFRPDILICGPTGDPQSRGADVSFSLSYLSSLTTAENEDTLGVLYYRNYTFDTLVCPDLGISLVELSVTCPGSYYSSDPTSLKPLVADLDTEHGNVSGLDLVDLEEDADNISEEESNVADHLASLLSDNVGNGTVQVVGDNWFFALKFSNHSANAGFLYSCNADAITDGAVPVPTHGLAEAEQLPVSCIFEEDEFLGADAEIFAFLPPLSAKNMYIKLNMASSTVGDARADRLNNRVLLSKLRQKLKTLCWCSVSDDTIRFGMVTKRSLPAGIFSALTKSLVLPAVQFYSEIIGPGSTSTVGEATSKKMYQLTMPAADKNVNSTSVSMASFKLPASPVIARTFYNLTVKAGLTRDPLSREKRRYLELAVIVFEGHHVGMTLVGPGTGKAARARLGASYILPVVSVDPLPAAAAAAVAVASSSSMQQERKAINWIEVGTGTNIDIEGNGRHISETEDVKHTVKRMDSVQSRMVCSGVLVSGQLRKVFAMTDQNSSQPIEHTVKLCFTGAGKYTVYTLARQWSGDPSDNSSNVDKQSAPSQWWLDSSPVLLSVQTPQMKQKDIQ